MTLLETVKQARGMIMVDEGGGSSKLVLLPGFSKEQISALEDKLPCSIPTEIKDLLDYTSGFENGPLEGVNFTGAFLSDFDVHEILPYGLPIAHDGCGNYWVIDLVSQSQQWGPVFYVCHDPAVIVYQADDLKTFITDIIRFSNPPHQGDLDEVQEKYSMTIWKNNPNVLSYHSCINSTDKSLKEFATMLDETYQIIDLRNPRLGDGFSWGRYGPRTVIKRHKEERLFAYQVRKSFFQRLFGK